MYEFEKRISGIEKFSILDFPGKLSAILFYTGCNFTCPYCYNDLVVQNKMPLIESSSIKNFLRTRQNKLEGIVFSGGECTIHGNALLNDIKFCKNLVYKIKIDTNGTNPKIIKKAIEYNLVDYIALDFKTSLKNSKANMFFPNFALYNNFEDTLDYLIEINFPFEARTTVHSDCIKEEDINDIMEILHNKGYKGKYYIQFFFNTGSTLGNVSEVPEYFDKSKLIIPEGIEIEYRNE